MRFKRFKHWLSEFWLKANLEWAKAGEMQKQIDNARTEHLIKYNRGRWHI